MTPELGRFRRLGGESLWIILGQVAAMLGSLALVRAMTGALTPHAYGELALGLTIAAIINQVVTGSVANGVVRYWIIADERADHHGYLKGCGKLLLLAFGLIGIIGIIGIPALLWFGLGDWASISFASLALAIFSGVNGALNGIQTAARQRPIVALHSAADSWLKIGLALALIAWVGPSSAVVIWGYTASAAAISLSQGLFLYRLVRKRVASTKPTAQIPLNWSRAVWEYSWPFATWGLFTWAQQASDRWSLMAYTGEATVGAYAVLYQLGYAPIATASGLLVVLVAPIMFERSGDATDPARNLEVARATWRLTYIAIAATLVGGAITFLISDWLFSILVAEAFRAHAGLLGYMVIAGGLFAAGQLLSVRTHADMTVRRTIPVKIGSALLGVALNVLLARSLGLDGVVYGVLGFSVIYLVWMAALIRRIETSPHASRLHRAHD